MKQQSTQKPSSDGGTTEDELALARDAALAEIAKDKLGIKTLEERGRDGLDFYDCEDGSIAVRALKAALREAYELGRKTIWEARAKNMEEAIVLSCRDLKGKVTFLGKTTMKRMLDAVYDEKDPLYKRNVYSECMIARSRFEADPKVGDEVIYVYYHPKNDETIMTNIENDYAGMAGSSAGFDGKIESKLFSSEDTRKRDSRTEQ